MGQVPQVAAAIATKKNLAPEMDWKKIFDGEINK